MSETNSLDVHAKTRAPRGTDRSPEYNEHFFLSKSESMTATFVKLVRTATMAIFQFRIVGCIRFVAVAFRSEEEVLSRKGPSLTYLMHHLSCMHPGIYVTSMVPCLVNAVDFLLYKLHVVQLQSPVIYPVCTPWNSIFKCISYAQTINITPTWIHLWADLAEKPKHMCRAMITSSLPSLVNIHQ